MAVKSNKLVEQEDALGAFFESLMRDVEAYEEHELVAPVAAAQPAQPKLVEAPPEPTRNSISRVATPVDAPKSQPREVMATKPLDVKTQTPSIFETLPPIAPPSPVIKIAPSIKPVPAVVEVKAIKVEAVVEPQKASAPPPAPDWLGQELQAMLFKVAGLTLAVPLVDLNGVVEWNDEKMTAMPGHADFYLGLMSHLSHNVPVVDTARLVLPEKKRMLLAGEDPRQRITRVVLISDGRYGLACDEVNQVVTLKADAVRWRTERTQRRWLAGTVVEHMCALVDATAFAELLANRAPVDAFRD
jgi:purine-binding chemotaxis protein CheW